MGLLSYCLGLIWVCLGSLICTNDLDAEEIVEKKSVLRFSGSGFPVEEVEWFMPGITLDELHTQIKKVNPDGELPKSFLLKGEQFYEFKKRNDHVHYEVYFQLDEEKKIKGTFFKWPHDYHHAFILEALRKRWGQYQQYITMEQQGAFIWDSPNQLKKIYLSECSLTCFPQFILLTKGEEDKTFLKDLWRYPY